MSKRKRKGVQFDEFDTEFFAQLDFLENDYGNALETIEQQEKDIQKLMALLIENGIAIPSSLVDRYIKRIPDTDDMEELFSVKNGDHCAVNQVLYHLGSRGVEYDLMPWLEEHHVPLMAYCPLAQGGDLRRGLLNNKAVQMVAEQRHITAMQVLLAFVLHHENVIAIPRSGKAEHVLENCQAAEIKLTEEEYRLLDRAFPAPGHKVWLDIV